MSDTRDRRRFVRFPASFAVLVRRLGPGEDSENLARTKVVGQGGCLFVHPEPVGLEETVELLISAGLTLVEAKARVAYEQLREDGRYDIGVEFLAISPQDQEKLQKALEVFQKETPTD